MFKTGSIWFGCTLALLLSPAAAAEPWRNVAERLEMSACRADQSVLDWTGYYVTHADSLAQGLARAEPWIGLIASEIERRQLPGELALVPLLESGFDPYAYSRRGAAGAWQLLEETARELGMTIDEHFDDRRDMPMAIAAGLDYLELLHWRLDQRWDLALAAYNAGPGRVGRLLAGGMIGDQAWLSPALPGETRIYLIRLLALACLLDEPERFGFRWPAVAAGRQAVSVKIEAELDLARLVKHAGLEPATLVELNAGLRQMDRPMLAGMRLHVPVADLDQVLAALDQSDPARAAGAYLAAYRTARQAILSSKARRLPESRNWHQVSAGETLWTLSQRYSVSVAAIRRSNGLGSDAELRPGDLIQIPDGDSATLPSQYRVQPGDTIWGIARDQGIPVRRLKQLNGLAPGAVLQVGQVIELGESRCCDQIPSLFEPVATGR